MAYTAQQLITQAWYTSGIVARGLQVLQPSQLYDGLNLLNNILSLNSVRVQLVPFFKRYEFTGVIGQEEYLIENLLYAELLTFNLNSVRFSVKPASREEYFAVPRVDNIDSLPFIFRQEREETGTRLYIYYKPNQEYPFQLSGKFGLLNVGIDTDLSETYPEFYITYLRFALAKYMCQWYTIAFPPACQEELKEIIKELRNVSPPDLKVRSVSVLGDRNSLNWGLVNFPGWVN